MKTPIYVHVDREKCTGCGICVEECPFQAIAVEDCVATVLGSCGGCLMCLQSCPFEAISFNQDNTQDIAWAPSPREANEESEIPAQPSKGRFRLGR